MEPVRIKTTDEKKEISIASVHHALEALNAALDENADEIRHLIKTDYRKVKQVLTDAGPQVKGALTELKSAGIESVRQAGKKAVEVGRNSVKKVDNTAHQSPWFFVGGAAAGSAI